MVYSVDDRGRLDLNTRVLERNYGDMLTDPQLVYDGAGGMALLFLNAKQEAERQERYSAVWQTSTRSARVHQDSGNERRSGGFVGENPPLISQRSALREAWVQDLRESGVQSRQPKVSCVPKLIFYYRVVRCLEIVYSEWWAQAALMRGRCVRSKRGSVNLYPTGLFVIQVIS